MKLDFTQEWVERYSLKVHIAKSGATVWASLLATVVRDDSGKPLYGFAMVLDITKRKSTEEILRTSLALLNVPIGSAILIELDGKIAALNSTASERLPAEPGDILRAHLRAPTTLPALLLRRLPQAVQPPRPFSPSTSAPPSITSIADTG